MNRARFLVVPTLRLSLVLSLFSLVVLCSQATLREAMAQPIPDTISGTYVSQTDPRGTLRLMLAPSKKNGQPVSRVWGVISYKDPRVKGDTCMFEFQSTIKSNVITCRDALNSGCSIRLHLGNGNVVLESDPRCIPVYCKGQGHVIEGTYVRVKPRAKHRRHP